LLFALLALLLADGADAVEVAFGLLGVVGGDVREELPPRIEIAGALPVEVKFTTEPGDASSGSARHPMRCTLSS